LIEASMTAQSGRSAVTGVLLEFESIVVYGKVTGEDCRQMISCSAISVNVSQRQFDGALDWQTDDTVILVDPAVAGSGGFGLPFKFRASFLARGRTQFPLLFLGNVDSSGDGRDRSARKIHNHQKDREDAHDRHDQWPQHGLRS
jgi:hypothetical protein